MGAGKELCDLAETGTKRPGGAARRPVPAREQEEPARALQAERDFRPPFFFILQKKTGKLTDWPEKGSADFNKWVEFSGL